jgi:hypothetical protein
LDIESWVKKTFTARPAFALELTGFANSIFKKTMFAHVGESPDRFTKPVGLFAE